MVGTGSGPGGDTNPGEHLERTGKIDTVVPDKTGTTGGPATDIYLFGAYRERPLTIIASGEINRNIPGSGLVEEAQSGDYYCTRLIV